jgi:hypothetical protein
MVDKVVDLKKKRDERNRDIVERMKRGESLTSFNTKNSWFPPRPVIEKNKEVLKLLYEKEDKSDKN